MIAAEIHERRSSLAEATCPAAKRLSHGMSWDVGFKGFNSGRTCKLHFKLQWGENQSEVGACHWKVQRNGAALRDQTGGIWLP